MNVLASTSGDVLDYALAVFFVASGAGLAYMLIRLGGTFARLSSFIKGAERDLLPGHREGGRDRRSRERPDRQARHVTDSAVSMADSADTAVRAVSTAITTPVKKVSGLAAAVSHGVSALPRAPRRGRGSARREGSGRESARASSTRSSAGPGRRSRRARHRPRSAPAFLRPRS